MTRTVRNSIRVVRCLLPDSDHEVPPYPSQTPGLMTRIVRNTIRVVRTVPPAACVMKDTELEKLVRNIIRVIRCLLLDSDRAVPCAPVKRFIIIRRCAAL